MKKADFIEFVRGLQGDRWGPMSPEGKLNLTPKLLADILEKLGLLTENEMPPLPLSYDPKCPVCDAQPHRACEGREIGDPHIQRRELAWQLQYSDLEDRVELLERRAADDDDEDG